jgi:N-acetylmuramoyl-L-alanine amidase
MRANWSAIILLIGTIMMPTGSVNAKVRLRNVVHIALDPGHGGYQPGTIGVTGTYEKHLTLPISLEVERLLRKYTNARVTLTRRTDKHVGLRERTRIANDVQADLFLSIHCNASHNKRSHGVETYFLAYDSASTEITKLVAREESSNGRPGAAAPSHHVPPNLLDKIINETQRYGAHTDSEKVAEIMLRHLRRHLKARRRGVFQAPFAVLKEAEMPAIVVEVGFLSHPVEGKKLTQHEYQKKVARAIYKAILELDRTLVR